MLKKNEELFMEVLINCSIFNIYKILSYDNYLKLFNQISCGENKDQLYYNMLRSYDSLDYYHKTLENDNNINIDNKKYLINQKELIKQHIV